MGWKMNSHEADKGDCVLFFILHGLQPQISFSPCQYSRDGDVWVCGGGSGGDGGSYV